MIITNNIYIFCKFVYIKTRNLHYINNMKPKNSYKIKIQITGKDTQSNLKTLKGLIALVGKK